MGVWRHLLGLKPNTRDVKPYVNNAWAVKRLQVGLCLIEPISLGREGWKGCG